MFQGVECVVNGLGCGICCECLRRRHAHCLILVERHVPREVETQSDCLTVPESTCCVCVVQPRQLVWYNPINFEAGKRLVSTWNAHCLVLVERHVPREVAHEDDAVAQLLHHRLHSVWCFIDWLDILPGQNAGMST